MQQESEAGIKMLRKLSPVPKSFQMHFRYHGIEGSAMLPGDLGPQGRHLVQVAGIITVRHIPRCMWDSNFGLVMERWRVLGKLLKTYRHSNLQKCCHRMCSESGILSHFSMPCLVRHSQVCLTKQLFYFIFSISGVCWRPTGNIHNCILKLCKNTW